MKKLILGAAFALAVSAATAGSVAPPIIEQDVVIEQAATSSVSHHIMPPAFFLISVGLGMLLI